MYKLIKKHRRPVYRKGDLEDETVTAISIHQTMKQASLSVQADCPKIKDKFTKNNRTLYYSTGKTWVNENSGETCLEAYIYQLVKL